MKTSTKKLTKFGKILEDKALAPAKMSRIIGITPESLYNYRRLSNKPNVKTALKIAKFLNMSVEEIWGE